MNSIITTPKLNFPEFNFKFEQRNSAIFIFDNFRKKLVILSPEEWVRQNLLTYLFKIKNYPASLIAVEKQIKFNKMIKRFDAAVYTKQGFPAMIIECKAPNVEINQNVFDQICRYNLTLNVKYLLISNGLKHLCYYMDIINNSSMFLSEIPNFNELNN